VVIAAVVVEIGIVAMEASSMAMKLHIPLEAFSTLVTIEHARGEVAAFNVGH